MSKNKSFTLIELLVVIVIIGILAGVIMISTSSSIDKANFAKAQTFSNTVQEELLLNLLSEWMFDEPEETGRITKDSWGNNHGVVTGAIQVNNCVSGKCYSFDGQDDYIEMADNQQIRMTQGGTITAWINPNGPGESSGRILDKSATTSIDNGFAFYLSGDGKTILFGIKSGAIRTTSSNNAITLKKWNFAVVVFNNLGRRIYVNGVDVTSSGGNVTDLPPDIAGIVRIGNRAGGTDRTFDGYIDEVRVYNTVLSVTQIKQNYIAGLNSMLSNGNISKEKYNQRIESLGSK